MGRGQNNIDFVLMIWKRVSEMKRKVLAAAIASLSVYAGGALAQDDGPVEKKRSNRLLEEVTVTAQKREEDA